jgi:hypothetical protein
MRKMSTNEAKGKKNRPKTKLGIPDLEHSKAAVLRSLGSPDSRRGYQHAIDEFVAWCCSEPRLAFNPRWSPQNRPYVVTSKPAIEIGLRRDCFTVPHSV